jgi:hypothetical protein
VEKARHIMPGHDDKKNGAFWSTDEITAVVKCIDYGKRPLVVLIVTSDQRSEARRTLESLKDRMFD